MHLGRLAGNPGMTDIAIFNRPGDLTVVAGSAEFTIDNFQHVDLVAPGFHLEPEIGVANLATKSNAMKPVRENHRAHTGCVGEIVD